MKIRVPIFLFLLFAGIPRFGVAQSRFRSKHLKYVDEARHNITSTIIPVTLGFGSATFSKNKAIQTTGSLLAVYGLILGPSTGNIYARDYFRGMLGIAVQLGGGYLMKDATRVIMGDNIADVLGWDHKSVSLTNTRVLIGAGLIVGSAIYNLI